MDEKGAWKNAKNKPLDRLDKDLMALQGGLKQAHAYLAKS